MKKQLFRQILLTFLFIGITSCSTEDHFVDSPSQEKMSVEMESFKVALISWVKAKNTSRNGKITNQDVNDVIIKEAKDLLKSENMIIPLGNSRSIENENAIISQAMQVYVKKIAKN